MTPIPLYTKYTKNTILFSNQCSNAFLTFAHVNVLCVNVFWKYYCTLRFRAVGRMFHMPCCPFSVTSLYCQSHNCRQRSLVLRLVCEKQTHPPSFAFIHTVIYILLCLSNKLGWRQMKVCACLCSCVLYCIIRANPNKTADIREMCFLPRFIVLNHQQTSLWKRAILGVKSCADLSDLG